MENEKLKNLASSVASTSNVAERVASPVNKPPEQITTPQLAPTIRSGTIKLAPSTSGGGGMLQLRRLAPTTPLQQSTDSQATTTIEQTPPTSMISKRTREEDTPEEADISSPSSNLVINLNKKSRSNVGDSSTTEEPVIVEQSSNINEPIVVEENQQAEEQQQPSQQSTSEFADSEAQQDTQGTVEFVEQEGNDDSVEFTDVVVNPSKSDGSSQHQVEDSSQGLESVQEIDEGNVESGRSSSDSAVADEDPNTAASQTAELSENQSDMIETNQTENQIEIQQQTETTPQVRSTTTFSRPAFGASSTTTFGSNAPQTTTGSLFQSFGNNAANQGTIISTTTTIPRIRRPLGPNIQASASSTTSAFGQPARAFLNPSQQQQQQGEVNTVQSFPPNQYRLVNQQSNRFPPPQNAMPTNPDLIQSGTRPPFIRGPRAPLGQQQNPMNQAGSPGGNPAANASPSSSSNQPFGRGAGGGGGAGSLARGTGRPQF